MIQGITKFIQDGGFWMYPIMLVMAVGIALSIERYIYLSLSRISNRLMISKVLPLLQRGEFQEAFRATSKSNLAVSRMLSQGLARYKSAHNRDEIEMAMEESMLEVIPRLEKRTHYIATFANIATLLGLLGTIIGLIDAFAAISAVDPSQKAKILSTSISVAMNTTAFGLIVAIPLLLMHAVLQSKTTEIVDSLEMATVKFVNMIMQRKSSKEAKEPKES